MYRMLVYLVLITGSWSLFALAAWTFQHWAILQIQLAAHHIGG